MTTISTQRHLYRFYIILTTTCAFFLFYGSTILLSTIDKLIDDELEGANWIFFLLGLGMVAFSIHHTFIYFKKTPVVTIKNDVITFGDSESFLIKDITDITFSTKIPFSSTYTYRNEMEGMIIEFKNGTEKVLYDDLYENLWEIKSFLYQVVEQQQAYQSFEVNQYEFIDLTSTETKVFDGNQFTSFRGIILWFFVAYFVYSIYSMTSNSYSPTIIYSVLFLIAGILFFSWMMNYIIITNDYLVIKNHNIWFWQNIYALKDIEEIVFETARKSPNAIRIITKDFKSNSYKASTLSDTTWLQLKEQLNIKGIEVRNEII
ncbi:hypothetical protein VB776_00180 [Arcicella sp. DC2W]|uniref:Uncharacterized protein n=1 Tax=Arcicella gelida TaxID=2984195 RepID=A0ABU5RYL2_9BACT|nr:hypothetical protein [Arcicella sp. DC2W]MEA5401307.1 hypothetical protein [Arcicella sp. DC2W]